MALQVGKKKDSINNSFKNVQLLLQWFAIKYVPCLDLPEILYGISHILMTFGFAMYSNEKITGKFVLPKK